MGVINTEFSDFMLWAIAECDKAPSGFISYIFIYAAKISFDFKVIFKFELLKNLLQYDHLKIKTIVTVFHFTELYDWFIIIDLNVYFHCSIWSFLLNENATPG